MAIIIPSCVAFRKQVITIMFCSCILFLSGQNSLAIQAGYYQKATQLINNKDYVRAYKEVQKLLEEKPEDIYLLRIKGVCLMETGYHDGAVAVLGKAVAIDPKSVSSRYFLGQAYAYRGSIKEAIVILESALELAPDSAYAKHTNTILPQLRELVDSATVIGDENRWNTYFSTALEYDDNVPLRSSNSEEQGSTESWRFNYSFYGEVRFPDQKLDNTPFTLGLGYSLSGSEYEDSIFDPYDLFSQDVSLYLSRNGTLWDNFYNLRVSIHASDTKLGWDPYSKMTGGSLSLQYNWLGMIASTLLTSWDNKDYEFDTEYPEYYSLDGNEYNTGLLNSIYLLDNRLILGLNYNYRIMKAEGVQAELRSNDVTTSLTANLPLRLRFYAQIAYQQEDYPDYYPVDRLDDIWTLYTSLQRPVWKDALLLELSYTHATANSDYDYADYERNVFGVALSLAY